MNSRSLYLITLFTLALMLSLAGSAQAAPPRAGEAFAFPVTDFGGPDDIIRAQAGPNNTLFAAYDTCRLYGPGAGECSGGASLVRFGNLSGNPTFQRLTFPEKYYPYVIYDFLIDGQAMYVLGYFRAFGETNPAYEGLGIFKMQLNSAGDLLPVSGYGHNGFRKLESRIVPMALVRSANGSVLVLGTTPNSNGLAVPSNTAAIVRLNANGAFDSSFNGGVPKVIPNFQPGTIAEFASSAGYEFFFPRYLMKMARHAGNEVILLGADSQGRPKLVKFDEGTRVITAGPLIASLIPGSNALDQIGAVGFSVRSGNITVGARRVRSGVGVPYIVGVNASFAVNTQRSFTAGPEVNTSIPEIAVDSAGKIYVSYTDGNQRSRVTLLSATGAVVYRGLSPAGPPQGTFANAFQNFLLPSGQILQLSVGAANYFLTYYER